MSVIAKETPEIYAALIGERDLYMTRAMLETLRNTPSSTAEADNNNNNSPNTIHKDTLVGVVGLAHIAGIERNLLKEGGFERQVVNCPVAK
jgi:pheromone shutdown protein TraB